MSDVVDDALRYGLVAFAVVFGFGFGLLSVLWLAAIAQRLAGAVEDVRAALRRYAHRDEVVIEYRDDSNMQHVRRYSSPKPDRVELVKKGQKGWQ